MRMAPTAIRYLVRVRNGCVVSEPRRERLTEESLMYIRQVGAGGWFPRSNITRKVVTHPSSQSSEEDVLHWSRYGDKMGGTTGADLDFALVPSVLY